MVGLFYFWVKHTAIMENTKISYPETWKDMIGFEGWYQVSSHARVRSLDRMVNAKLGSKCMKKGRVLVPSYLSEGYTQVRLCKNGNVRHYRIHQLVAIMFVENPNNYNQINHKNEIRDDNLPDNLEWCTVKYNNNYGTRMKRITEAMTNGKNSKKVIQSHKNGVVVKEWVSMMEAERILGVSNSKISMVCQGKRNSAGGFKWAYHEQN